jgi:hypothetical protein
MMGPTFRKLQMDKLQPGQVRFRIHGPDAASDESFVSASVFAQKLATLVAALKAADRAINGVLKHDYIVEKLKSSSPTVLLREEPLPKFEGVIASAIPAFDRCAHAVLAGEREQATRFGDCAAKLSKLAKGSYKTFGYAEVWTTTEDIIRVDPFLNERARSIIAPEPAKQPDGTNWFKGTAFGSFDGTVKAADLRGALPQIKLVLSAGDKQLDCVFGADDIEQIRTTLNKRVRVYGKAIYDGRSGLPRRVEANRIEPIQPGADLSSWKGSFEPFSPSEWEADDS